MLWHHICPWCVYVLHSDTCFGLCLEHLQVCHCEVLHEEDIKLDGVTPPFFYKCCDVDKKHVAFPGVEVHGYVTGETQVLASVCRVSVVEPSFD